ncbi:hypothetical protein BT93_A0409 [Corymbia citriodora subsp. variegata]|nr:hypothetical protein BT93_A0409 [Corymbia citriodora subsp. variegata]
MLVFMGSETKAGSFDDVECQCTDSVQKFESLTVKDTKKGARERVVSILDDQSYARRGVTLDVKGETGDAFSDLESPLLASEKEMACHTPKDDALGNRVIDGCDSVQMTHQKLKHTDEWRSSIPRQLNFGPATDGWGGAIHGRDLAMLSDEEVVELIYHYLLEMILHEKAEDLFTEKSEAKWDSDDCRTPPSAPRSNDTVESCPGAPVKRITQSRNVDSGLCRRLQF